MSDIIERMRKGDVFMAKLPQTHQYMLHGEHPVIIMSNYKICDYSSTIQIIPITSRDRRPLDTHIKISKGIANLDQDCTALAEQIQTIDKSLLLYKMGQLPVHIITEIDRAVNIQLNSNRVFNISFALKIVDNIIRLDNLTKKYGIEPDEDDKRLKKTLLNDLREYSYQWNIDYSRLLSERGIDENE